VELREETGLAEKDLTDFRQGVPLLLTDHEGNPWMVHTFTAVTARRRLTINERNMTSSAGRRLRRSGDSATA
jgi:hypothetical protein